MLWDENYFFLNFGTKIIFLNFGTKSIIEILNIL
jgi:hypothetical protein